MSEAPAEVEDDDEDLASEKLEEFGASWMKVSA